MGNEDDDKGDGDDGGSADSKEPQRPKTIFVRNLPDDATEISVKKLIRYTVSDRAEEDITKILVLPDPALPGRMFSAIGFSSARVADRAASALYSVLFLNGDRLEVAALDPSPGFGEPEDWDPEFGTLVVDGSTSPGSSAGSDITLVPS